MAVLMVDQDVNPVLQEHQKFDPLMIESCWQVWWWTIQLPSGAFESFASKMFYNNSTIRQSIHSSFHQINNLAPLSECCAASRFAVLALNSLSDLCSVCCGPSVVFGSNSVSIQCNSIKFNAIVRFVSAPVVAHWVKIQ